MATITPPIAARRSRPVLLASVQTRLARPATAIALIAPATTPPTGASVLTEDGVVNRRWTWSAVCATCAASRLRVSRIAAFMSAVEGARTVPVVRALCARLELQPFHRLAETLTRLLHTKFRAAYRSDEIAQRRSLPRRSASPRRVLTRPRLAGRGQSESARVRSRGRRRLRR